MKRFVCLALAIVLCIALALPAAAYSAADLESHLKVSTSASAKVNTMYGNDFISANTYFAGTTFASTMHYSFEVYCYDDLLGEEVCCSSGDEPFVLPANNEIYRIKVKNFGGSFIGWYYLTPIPEFGYEFTSPFYSALTVNQDFTADKGSGPVTLDSYNLASHDMEYTFSNTGAGNTYLSLVYTILTPAADAETGKKIYAANDTDHTMYHANGSYAGSVSATGLAARLYPGESMSFTIDQIAVNPETGTAYEDAVCWITMQTVHGRSGKIETTKHFFLKIDDASVREITGGEYGIQAKIATVSALSFEADGVPTKIQAYNIDDYTFFKLRDIAALCDATAKEFSVSYADGVTTLTTGGDYTVGASDLQTGDSAPQTALTSVTKVIVNGKEVALTSYNIGGYNYYKLRDLCKALDIAVVWKADSATNGIDTTKGYGK